MTPNGGPGSTDDREWSRDADASNDPRDEFGLPAGDLAFSRVVTDASAALTAVLDRRHSGYAVLTPSDALVLDDATHSVIGFRDGIPTHALSTDTRGSGALAAAATPGPLRVALYRCEQSIGGIEARIAPDTPARRLAGDTELAVRTRNAAPDEPVDSESPDVPDAGDDLDAVDAFLADEDAIERIKSQAREEAERRAREWGFDEFTDS